MHGIPQVLLGKKKNLLNIQMVQNAWIVFVSKKKIFGIECSDSPKEINVSFIRGLLEIVALRLSPAQISYIPMQVPDPRTLGLVHIQHLLGYVCPFHQPHLSTQPFSSSTHRCCVCQGCAKFSKKKGAMATTMPQSSFLQSSNSMASKSIQKTHKYNKRLFGMILQSDSKKLFSQTNATELPLFSGFG